MALVVFAGQSNIGGAYMDVSTLTRPYAPDPSVRIWNDQSKAWETMQVGVNTGYPGMTQSWGPEVQFALDFKARFPGETLQIVKIAHGGTGLRIDPGLWKYDWSPTSENELFDDATATIRAATQAAGLGRPDMLLWGQGEEDSTTAEAAAAYQQNLSAFFAAVRQEWLGDPAGKIGFFKLGGSGAYLNQVREAQGAVDAADPNAVSFDTLYMPRLGDGVHMSGPAHEMSGAEFFKIYAALRTGQQPGGGAGQRLDGGAGPDTLFGGPNGDSAAGSWGDDYLRGFEGDDLMSGGDGFDILQGNQGRDTLAGDEGHDWVVGGQNDDMLMGGEGNDIVHGNLGYDIVDGGAGNDTLYGGQADDSLKGWSGDDWLSGDRGADTLMGGSGADSFYVFAESGQETIIDFNPGEGDRILVAGGLSWTASQVGGDTVISLAGGAQVTLSGVLAATSAGAWIVQV